MPALEVRRQSGQPQPGDASAATETPPLPRQEEPRLLDRRHLGPAGKLTRGWPREVTSLMAASNTKFNEERLVFVSHCTKDRWVAKQIAREIKSRGAVPFLDETEIDVGDDFEDRILEFLQRADELLVLLTPWALDRPYVWAEVGAAWGRQIPIVGILHGMTPAELQSKPGMPVFLKKRDMIDINSIDVYFEELARRTASRRRQDV